MATFLVCSINNQRVAMVKLTKSKERVSEFGEVFTPEHIVKNMIALIPDDKWKDSSCIVLEPTCGNGNFIVEIIQKKIDSGLSTYNALNTTFGMDIMDDNIQECIDRVLRRFVIGKVSTKEYKLLTCVVINNIFTVADSLVYIQDGSWESKKFFKDDPTGTVKKKCPLDILLGKDSNAKQVLSKEDRLVISNLTDIKLKEMSNVD